MSVSFSRNRGDFLGVTVVVVRFVVPLIYIYI